jgi:riboflavin synthase
LFTGIVEEVGTVRSVEPGRLVINAKKVTWGTNLGDSIAVNGCDLTCVYMDEDAR